MDKDMKLGNLSEVLLGMIWSDTFVGAWGFDDEDRCGSFGTLKEGVKGGHSDSLDEVRLAKLKAVYPEQIPSANPYYRKAHRGDSATAFRYDSRVWLSWMTLTDQAYQALDALMKPWEPHEF